MSIITLTTDFGTGSPYVAAMKGVILSINPQARLVDMTHDIAAQDVRQGAVILENTSPWFPDDTIHVAVIDPGVGTDRAVLYARIGNQQYVVPDNGILSRLTAQQAPSKLIRLTEREHWLPDVSSTFHGRDIMAPVAARLSLGLEPERLGPPVDALAGLDWPSVRQSPLRLEGEVIEIDSFGNLITNVTGNMIAGRPTDERACVICNIYETWGVYRAYGDQFEGAFIALIGSSGRLELALVGDSAAERLGIQRGAKVIVTWE